MFNLTETIFKIGNYLSMIGLADIFDILIMSVLIYQFLKLISNASIKKLTKGVLFLLIVLWLSGILGLTMLNFILRKAVELGLIALVIIFQPELRRLLEKMGSNRLSGIFSSSQGSANMEGAITQSVLACSELSATHTGALIVFEKDNDMSDIINSGTILDAEVTVELLKNLFFVKAPLHDGAVVIRQGRIAAAGCILPMSANTNLSKELGMRHRAGIGMSERSDAVVLIVSEETGAVSVAVDGMLKRHLSAETVETLLRRDLIPDESSSQHKLKFPSVFGRKNSHE